MNTANNLEAAGIRMAKSLQESIEESAIETIKAKDYLCPMAYILAGKQDPQTKEVSIIPIMVPVDTDEFQTTYKKRRFVHMIHMQCFNLHEQGHTIYGVGVIYDSWIKTVDQSDTAAIQKANEHGISEDSDVRSMICSILCLKDNMCINYFEYELKVDEKGFENIFIKEDRNEHKYEEKVLTSPFARLYPNFNIERRRMFLVDLDFFRGYDDANCLEDKNFERRIFNLYNHIRQYSLDGYMIIAYDRPANRELPVRGYMSSFFDYTLCLGGNYYDSSSIMLDIEMSIAEHRNTMFDQGVVVLSARKLKS